jgi:anhydro-N-acetylmuramic acid kinase
MTGLYIGLMSGTSLDGIDAALVEFNNDSFNLIATHHHSIPDKLCSTLKKLALNDPGCSLDTLGEADAELGNIFADAVNTLLKQSNTQAADIKAIGSHGQTIRHRPDVKHPFTLQIADANKIAYLTGITTVADFRRKDMAAKGEGAPLAPAFHNAYFRSTQENRGVINIGGISNITFLPSDKNKNCLGFDTGPGNMLMDAWIHKHKNKNYDQDGQWAGSHDADDGFLHQLMQDPFILQSPPKSTGREHYHLEWLNKQLNSFPELSIDTVQASLCAFTSQSIQLAIKNNAERIDTLIVCGGGAQNKHLMSLLQEQLPEININSSDHYGLHPDWVEAVAFAWLAKQTINNKAGNLPEVTGASEAVILGSVFPA